MAPPLAPPAPPPEPPPPPPAPPRLSDLSFFFDKPEEAPPSRDGRIHIQSTRYGRGSLALRTIRRWKDSPPSCPLRLAGPCQTFSISSTGRSPDEAAWLRGEVVEEGKGSEQGPFPAPHEWIDFSGGREAIFALRKDGHVIDRIDDQGKVTVFAQDPSPQEWRQIQIHEIGSRVILLRQRSASFEDSYWEIAELLPAEGDAPRKPGPGSKLPMAPIHEGRPSAQGARAAVQLNGMAMFGSPSIVRLDDQKDWAMVWMEVVPPPYRWPAGKPQAAPKAPAKKGAKNGCGGPPSRGLDDRSVTKRAHVTRFSGASLVEDTVAWATSDLDVYSHELKFKVADGKVTVDPPPKASKPIPPSRGRVRRFFGEYEDLELSPAETIFHAAFDPEANEGLALVGVGEKLYTRAFDADGKWLGGAVLYKDPDPIPYRFLSLARLGSRWFALTRETDHPILNVTDSLKIENPVPGETPLFLHQQGGKLRLVTAKEDSLVEHALDEQGKPEGDPIQLGAIPSGVYPHNLRFHRAAGGPPMVAGFQEAGMNNILVNWRLLKPDAPWTKVDPYPDGKGAFYGFGLRAVHGDLVAVYHEAPRAHFTWLKAGKTVSIDQDKDFPGGSHEEIAQGAILVLPQGGSASVLPEAPGSPVVEPALASIERECSFTLPTRPDTLVLLCAQPVDDKKPGFRAGLRVYRRPAP